MDKTTRIMSPGSPLCVPVPTTRCHVGQRTHGWSYRVGHQIDDLGTKPLRYREELAAGTHHLRHQAEK
jgi:hypothetical protein